MGKVTEEVLLKMRDLIIEMEPHLDFNDNTILCCNRLSKIMESIVFNDTMVVVAGEILHYNEDKEYDERLRTKKK